jgi:glycogen synthase
MPLVTFYFQLHQPFRLHPEASSFFWEEMNRDVLCKVAAKCYLPATRMFTQVIQECPDFKITLSLSGIFLEQAERYEPAVLRALQDLLDAGRPGGQVEYLEETYYHSLTGLFEDKEKREFKDQVSLHRQKMKEIFGIRPVSFRNTELMYNNEIANVVADMGFKAILCEQRDDMFTPRDGKAISPNAVFQAKGRKGRPRNLVVIPRNRNLSDDVAFRFMDRRITPEEYADYIGRVDGEAICLGYDYEHIGEHIWADTGIFDFWRGLATALARHENIILVTPAEIAVRFQKVKCPVVDIHPLATSSWADMERDTRGWLGNKTQYVLFRDIQAMEREARKAGGVLLHKWRHLTTSDHLYYLHEGRGADHTVHEYFSPYGSITTATYLLTRNIDRLQQSIHSFNILKRGTCTPIVIITPETAKLPREGMGRFARFISGKAGGLGEVISALCKGLSDRQIPTHLITLNLKRRFKEESRMSEAEWIQSRHQLHPENIHLVTSAIFENNWSAYQNDPAETAAEFQRQIVNTYLKEIRSQHEGKAILHSHDWMAGGAISAYARMRQIPLLHTIHNTHTADIPKALYHGINLERLKSYLYMNNGTIDSQASAVKNADIVSFVGKKFLFEVVNDYFLDSPFIPWSVRLETKAKHFNNQTWAIPNGISPDLYPENQPENPAVDQPGLASRFTPAGPVVPAKRANQLKFQKRMGLNVDENAILLFWPSRLDPMQKGIALLEEIALKFVIENGDVQIAVVGDSVSGAYGHVEIMGRIAYASGGKIAYRGFDDELCMLGYAAASDVFGASLYEPFGQIDVLGNLYGATATNRDTGGYSDKIAPLSLKILGAPQNIGNGVLFKDYDASALWWGLTQTVSNHRVFRQNPLLWEKQLQRIMKEARKNWSLENMVAGYLTAYKRLGGSMSLSVAD